MSRLVEIDCCMDCPYRSCRDYYDASTCDLLDDMYLFTCSDGKDFGIHIDCPLPCAQDS